MISNKRSTKTNIWSVIVDIDGCLANWNEAFYELLASLHGDAHAGLPTFKTWDWPKTECGYTQKQVDAAWDKIDDMWWMALQPYPGTFDALKLLAWLDEVGKTQVTFVTGRYPSARNASALWLVDHGYRSPHVLTTSRKEAVAKALAANGPVAVIEDKPTLIEGYANSQYVNLVYAIDQPYNRNLVHDFTVAVVARKASTLEAVKHLDDQIALEKW